MLSLDVTQAGGLFAIAAIACSVLYAVLAGPLRDLGWRRASMAELDLADRLMAGGGVAGQDAARELRECVADRAIRHARRRRVVRRVLPGVADDLKVTLVILATDALWLAMLAVDGTGITWPSVIWCAITFAVGAAADKARAHRRSATPEKLGEERGPEEECGDGDEHPGDVSHGAP